jgi:hypothetical protein
MIKKITLIVLLFAVAVSAQETNSTKAFSKYWFGGYAGVSFNTVPTIGGAFQIAIKTNLTSRLNMKAMLGYSTIYENKEYTVKSYTTRVVEGEAVYQTVTYDVDKIQYSVIPVGLGFEYTFSESEFAPFAALEFAYNSNGAEEQITQSISGDSYNSKDDIPAEFRDPRPEVNSDGFMTIGFGGGLKYKISESIEFDLKYVFQYNTNDIPVTHQILFGIML